MNKWLFWFLGNLIGWAFVLWTNVLGDSLWACVTFSIGGTVILATNYLVVTS